MATQNEKEVLGDWSNLKGTRYHLTYAIWLLLRRHAKDVRFFAGNDLTASPISPPKSATGNEVVAAIISGAESNTDVWIQLKATREPWTVSAVLDENLLFNFICNAAASERNGRNWKVALVTEAEVRKNDLLDFVSNTATKPQLELKLREVVNRSEKHLLGNGFVLTRAKVEQFALTILRVLADTEPLHFATLKAEIETELALAVPDRASVHRIASTLIGAMLDDAGQGPTGRVYDSDWLNQEAETPILSDKIFDVDVISACDQSVASATEQLGASAFHAEKCTPRSGLWRSLNRFLSTQETVFVLIGRSGSGKSWSVADWLRTVLAGRVRLYISGRELRPDADIYDLAAQQLGRLTMRDWSSKAMMEKLKAAADATDRGPLLFAIDDLRVTAGTAEHYQTALARLVHEARQLKAKLLITCQTEMWESFGLHRYLPRNELYAGQEVGASDTGTNTGHCRMSHVLGQFTPDEFEDAVEKRLPSDRLSMVLNQLRNPSYALLRSPYLLDLYLEQTVSQFTKPGQPLETVDIDKLLAAAIVQRVEKISCEFQTDATSINVAIEAMTDVLWERRRQETPTSFIVRTLDEAIPDLGQQLLAALRRAGILAASSPVTWADDLTADHLYAVRFIGRFARKLTELENLDPELDSNVIEAIVRISKDGVDLANRLLENNERFRSAVAKGLASRSVVDSRAALMLCATVRPTDDYIANGAGCDALGTFAALSSRRPACRIAWRHTMQLFLSGDPREAFRGACALRAAFVCIPQRVARIVRIKIVRELGITGRRRREAGKAIRTSLIPVTMVTHRQAADFAVGLLEWVRPQIESLPDEEAEEVIPVLNEIRGRAALVHGHQTIDILAKELSSDDRIIRLRAAEAIREVVFEEPGLVLQPICDQLAIEVDPDVSLRLLWASYPLLSIAPDRWLSSFSSNPISWWSHPVPAGPALAMLGLVAEHRPREVARLLPTDLNDLPIWVRACLRQVHALAWSQCASRNPESYVQLEEFTKARLGGVPRSFHVFVHRAAFVANLGIMIRDQVQPLSIGVRLMSHREGRMPYCYADVEEFVDRNAQKLASLPDANVLLQSLRDCVWAAHQTKINPVSYRSLSEAVFSCTRDALDNISTIACTMSDPLSEIRSLPRDWEAMRAGRRLLERGFHSQECIAFAVAACEEHVTGGTMNASHERGLCLAELARHTGTPSETIAATQSLGNQSGIWLGFGESENVAIRIARVIDDNPEKMLSLIDLAISTPKQTPGLFWWSKLSRSWRAVAFSEVYRRMFSAKPIRRVEALRLVDSVLTVVRSLPQSAEREEYETVYSAIVSWLEGRPSRIMVEETYQSSYIRRSHVLTAELLNKAIAYKQQEKAFDCHSEFMDNRFWWQSFNLHIENDSLSFGGGERIYLIAILPALRLAGVALGWNIGLVDPAGAIMFERYTALEELSTLNDRYFLRETDPTRLSQKLDNVIHLCHRYLDNERLLRVRGNLELRLGKLEDARRSLADCIAHPLCANIIRSSALYDLACVEARCYQTDYCHKYLSECLELNGEYRHDIGQDSDFDSVKDLEWFKDFQNV
jgi:hypothetical protein